MHQEKVSNIQNTIQIAREKCYKRIVVVADHTGFAPVTFKGRKRKRDVEFPSSGVLAPEECNSDIILKIDHAVDSNSKVDKYRRHCQNKQRQEFNRAMQFDDCVPVLISKMNKSNEFIDELSAYFEGKNSIFIELPIANNVKTKCFEQWSS